MVQWSAGTMPAPHNRTWQGPFRPPLRMFGQSCLYPACLLDLARRTVYHPS